jgi:hypothetical protein
MTGLAGLDERGVHAADRRAGLTDAQLATLARNSFDACSADDADKQRWKAGGRRLRRRGRTVPAIAVRAGQASGPRQPPTRPCRAVRRFAR